MTTPAELERAAGNLAGLARDLERFDPWGGTRSKSDASDLRLLLSERAELLAAVERMQGQIFSVGDLLSYDMDGVLIRCTYRGDCEGWPLVSFDADGPDAVAIHVRPSKVKARAALTTGEGK